MCIIQDYGSTFYPCVQLAGNAVYRRSQYAGKLLEGDQFVVPGEFVCPRDTGSCQVVVELVDDEAAPGLGQRV